MTVEKPKQMAWVREQLLRGRAITPLDALNEAGCFRLGARIWDLKRQGLPIATEMVETVGGARVARYSLMQGQGELPWGQQSS